MNNNVATVNAIYEAFGKGDIPVLMNYLSDEVEWEQWEDNYAQRAAVPWMKQRKGKEEVFEFFKLIGEFIFHEFRVISLMSNENRVAVEMVVDIEIPKTGGHLKEEYIHLWSFDEHGKVTRFRHYADTAKHIEVSKHSMQFNL